MYLIGYHTRIIFILNMPLFSLFVIVFHLLSENKNLKNQSICHSSERTK